MPWPQTLSSLSTASANATTSANTHPSLHNDANAAVNRIEAEIRTGTGVFNVKHYGAAGDGTTNDTTAVQAALTAASAAGGGVVWFPPGTYLTAPGLAVGANTTLAGGGHRSIIKASAASAHVVVVSGSVGARKANVTLRDLAIDGARTGQVATQSGVFVSFADRVRVERCYIHHTGWHGVEFSEETHDARATENVLDSCYGDGIVTDYATCRKVLIRGNTLTNTYDCAIGLHTGSYDIVVADNLIDTTILAAGIDVAGCDDAVIHDNLIRNTQLHGIRCNANLTYRSTRIDIHHNTVSRVQTATNAAVSVFDLHGRDPADITGAIVYYGYRIAANTIYDCPRGMYLYGSRWLVQDNLIEGTTGDYAIFLDSGATVSTGNVFERNTIRDAAAGISVPAAAFPTTRVLGNRFEGVTTRVLGWTPPQATITAATTLSPEADHDTWLISSSGAVTVTATPSIADGVEGQRLLLLNIGAQDITYQDQGTLASSNLRLTAAGITLTPRDSVLLYYSTFIGDWVQVGPVVAVL